MSEVNHIMRRRRTKSGEAAPPKQPPPSPDNKNKKNRYNLRSKKKPILEENVRWVDDDTLFDDYDSADDSTFKGDDDDDDEDTDMEDVQEKGEPKNQIVHGISIPSTLPVSVKIHLHARVDEEDEEDYDDDEEEEEEDDSFIDNEDDDGEIPHAFIQSLFSNRLGQRGEPMFIITDDKPKPKKGKPSTEEPPLKLSRKEREFFEDVLCKKEQKEMMKKMKSVSEVINDSDVPYKFRVLEIDMPPKIQGEIIRKVDAMNRMGSDNGESQKLRNWIDGVLRIPFGKNVPLPVTIKDGEEKCAVFLKDARDKMDKATYGMLSAKTQILQVLAQWISNPDSVGNVIAMRGSMGVGKTSFARNGIAEVLKRPFIFTSLGGASDIAHYTGHSYTYEGSMWGRIVDSIIQAGCMNPVLYFDELDKVSGTPHGEEIISMLIHLTDRSQNCHYHDRYFAGIDFDLSQCLFVFSFNDESRVHPVLKDRMRVINIPGYKETEKKIIVANYIWPEILKHAGIAREDLSATEEAAQYIIKEYSSDEEGVRNLIRVVEAVVSRVNLIRISDEASAKAYKFYLPIKFPMKLEKKDVETLLADFNTTLPEHWRSLYT